MTAALAPAPRRNAIIGRLVASIAAWQSSMEMSMVSPAPAAWRRLSAARHRRPPNTVPPPDRQSGFLRARCAAVRPSDSCPRKRLHDHVVGGFVASAHPGRSPKSSTR